MYIVFLHIWEILIDYRHILIKIGYSYKNKSNDTVILKPVYKNSRLNYIVHLQIEKSGNIITSHFEAIYCQKIAD